MSDGEAEGDGMSSQGYSDHVADMINDMYADNEESQDGHNSNSGDVDHGNSEDNDQVDELEQ